MTASCIWATASDDRPVKARNQAWWNRASALLGWISRALSIASAAPCQFHSYRIRSLITTAQASARPESSVNAWRAASRA